MPEENEEKIYQYERCIGYTNAQLGRYDDRGRYIPYSEEEQTRIKDELERHFNEKISSWERNGFAKCFKDLHVIRKKMDNLMMKKFYEEAKRYTNDLTKSKEERLMGLEEYLVAGAFKKIENDNDIVTMYRYYSSENEGRGADNKLKNKDKNYIKRKLYDAIKSEDALDIASLRFDSSENIYDYAASIKELQEYHNSRGSFYWLFHPINCIKENNMIKSLKTRAIEKLGCNLNELNDVLEDDIKFGELTNPESYHIESYANDNANGTAYSVEAIRKENGTIADRADADYTKLQNEIERVYNGEDLNNNENELRQNIEVDGLKNNDSFEPNHQLDEKDLNKERKL